MRIPVRVLFAFLVLATPRLWAQSPAPAPSRPVDWESMRDEAVRVLTGYLRIDTSNPPGHELDAARYLEGILEREGFEVQILDTTELGRGRANLYARLKGNGSKKAIALLHHMDVVPVDRRYWTVDPFAGTVKDGYVWGRGAIDMKGEGIAHLMAMLALKRSGVPLTRDIVFIGNSDEELNGAGARTFVRRHADLLRDVEYLFTEGGENVVEHGRFKYYGVSVAEKRALWQRITVKGVPSHGSRPTKQNPVPRLVAALDRIAHYETPLRVTPAVERYFRDIARFYSGDQARWLRNVRTSLADPRARAWILSDVYWNAYLRNTISLTVLAGSNKTNVIPAEASADLDIRILPDQDSLAVLTTLKRVVNDTAVTWSPLGNRQPPLDAPINTDLFRAIERAAREREPNALVTTNILTGATDRPPYRELGIITYGFDPFRIDKAERQRGTHGNDERLSVENVGFGVHYLYDVLRYAQ